MQRINNRSLIQTMLYNNSISSTTRRRIKPNVFDPAFIVLNFIKGNLKKTCVNLKPKVVYDIGCGEMPYKKIFKGVDKYIGIDNYSTDPEVIKKDIENFIMDFGEKADLIICIEVLEHIYNYQSVIDSIYNNLNEGGTFFVSVPFANEVHGWDYNDYRRFTDQSLLKIFLDKGFKDIKILKSNSYFSTILLKLNIFIYYIPIFYILKIPFFFLINLIILAIEFIVDKLSVKENSIFHKVLYSFPSGYVIIGTK